MVDLIVKGTSSLSGTVRAPSSKAHTHRAFVAASLSEGCSEIEGALLCDDTMATINACRMLGAHMRRARSEVFRVQGRPKPLTPRDVIQCRESGATMRFLMSVCALADGISVLAGGRSLRRRPMKPLLEALRQLGVQGYSTRLNGCPPLVVFGGGIKGGKARIRGDVSSQFISGLLFSTPMAESDTEIVLASPLQSRPYVEVTLDVLRKHGINVEIQPSYVGFHVPCGQKYAPFDHAIEGDYSSAAFLLVAAAVTNSQVKVENLNPDSLQGDRLIAGLLREIGIQIEVSGGYVEVHGMAGKLRPVDVDLRDNPDLVPVVAVSACLAEGKSVIRGVKRLRIKESDRIAALSSELAKFGVKTKATDDVFEIIGGRRLRGADLDSHGDHRIAMACVVAALAAEGTSVIRGVECINKSYPSFVKDIRALGGEVAER